MTARLACVLCRYLDIYIHLCKDKEATVCVEEDQLHTMVLSAYQSGTLHKPLLAFRTYPFASMQLRMVWSFVPRSLASRSPPSLKPET